MDTRDADSIEPVLLNWRGRCSAARSDDGDFPGLALGLTSGLTASVADTGGDETIDRYRSMPNSASEAPDTCLNDLS